MSDSLPDSLPKCTACKTPLESWRIVGMYDSSDSPEELQQGIMNSPLYWSGTFLPLGLTVCKSCGHADFWSLPTLSGLPRDASERQTFIPPAKIDE